MGLNCHFVGESFKKYDSNDLNGGNKSLKKPQEKQKRLLHAKVCLELFELSASFEVTGSELDSKSILKLSFPPK